MARSDSEDAPGPVSKGETGFPQFEHNQWTVEGEIERFGAFGRGASQLHGPKRWVATALALLFVLFLLLMAIDLLTVVF